MQVLKLDKETSMRKRNEKKITLADLFIVENDPMVHICLRQKYVKLQNYKFI